MKKNQDNPQKVFERLNSLVNLVLGAVNTTAGKYGAPHREVNHLLAKTAFL